MTATPTATDTVTPTDTATATATATATSTATATATSTATVGPNLVRNPGMETDANADGKPDRWTAGTYVARSKASRHSGTYSMRHYATNNASYRVQQTIGGITIRPYTFSAWTNIPRTNDIFSYKLQVQWLNKAGQVLGSETVATYTQPTGGWQQATRTMTPPDGTVKARIVMRVGGLASTIYADDFSLR